MPATKRKPAKKSSSVDKTGTRDRYFSRAVGKALDVLALMQSHHSPLTLNEVAKKIQLSKTSAFRLLRTLEAAGCLRTNSQGAYHLIPEIASVIPMQLIVRLLRSSTPHLKEVSMALRETVSVAALFANRVEVIAVVESPEVLRMSNVVGHIVPPNASSLGKIITAYQNEERREKLLRSFGTYRFTAQTITDGAELGREFMRILNQGFATDREESVSDVCCFGVPIYSQTGIVSAAISMSMPKIRLRDVAHEKSIVRVLSETAKEISQTVQIP